MQYKHGFPGSRAFSMFGNNFLEYAVLDFLKDKSGRGHEITAAVREHFYGFYEPEMESVHNTLKMLVEMGYVNYADKEGEKVYTITGEGKEYLGKRQEMFHGFGDRMKERFKRMGHDWGAGYHHCGVRA